MSAAPTTTTVASTPSAATATGPSSAAGPLARIATLARAEAVLLLRNRTALFNGLLLAPGMVLFLAWTGGFDALGGAVDGAQVSALMLGMLLGMALLFVVYYNLVSALVARREELVLKRWRTGQARDGEILAAAAVPALLVMLGQLVLGAVAVVATQDGARVVNPVLAVLAVLGGTYVFAALAVASTAFTRSVEAAQLTTLPVIAVALVTSGYLPPLGGLSPLAADLAHWTPLGAVFDLTSLALTGQLPGGQAQDLLGTFAASARPVAALAAWAVVCTLLAGRSMRWEPRR